MGKWHVLCYTYFTTIKTNTKKGTVATKAPSILTSGTEGQNWGAGGSGTYEGAA